MEASSNRLSGNASNLKSPFHTLILVCLVAALSYFAARLGGALILRPQNAWPLMPLWPGCALLVSILLLAPRRIWPILIAAGLAAFALYDLQAGVPVRSIFQLIFADAVEVILTAVLVGYSFDGVPRLDSMRALAKYSLFAVILAPVAVSFLGAFAWPGAYWVGWRVSFFSEAIAFLTLPPAILGWAGKRPAWARESTARYFEAGALFAALVLFGWFTFVAFEKNSPPALLYSLVPFLLWAALRFGSTGLSTSMIVIALLSIWGAVHGRGPFTGQGPLDNVFSLQLFLLCAATPFMVLAVLVEAHRNSEQALKKSEEKFSIAFRESPSAFALTRLEDDRYIEVNDAFELITGYSRKEVVGRTSNDIRLWEKPSQGVDLLRQLRMEGRLRNVEVHFRTKDGRVRIGLASAEAIEIDGERCLLSVTSDITDLKQAQEARFRHAAIVESSDDAIIMKDLAGIILSWNLGASRIFGFTEAEAVGQPVMIIVPPELHAEEADIMRRLRSGKSIEHYETIRVTKGGKRIHVSLTMSPVRDAAGRVAGFSKIARNISDRKRAEQTLRESEERFRLVANKAPVLIWMSGTDKLCTFFNQCWLDFTGRSMEHELGEGWASGVHPEDLAGCLRTYSAAFDARVDFEMEYRLKRFDGKYRWVVDYGVPRFESDGTFCGYIGSCVDITDRKLSEASLEELSGRLITAQEEERTRIARELHDDFSQRLALQGIGLGQLWKKLLESQVEERAKVLELLKRTQEISSDLHSLSHQLHSSKLEHVGLVPALIGLCEEMSSQYRIQIEFTDRGISSEIPKDVALCLFRIAQEALGNVVKHSRAKQAQAELYGANNEIRLRIVDAGVGFDPALRSALAGMGLVSMRERLRLVGGRLSVRSEPMRGTEILVEVPLSVSANEAKARTTAAGGIEL
jgi:PAS domain S-box-containing protein